MSTDLPYVVAAPAHPSLDGAIARFCDVLGDEVRRRGARPGCAAALPSLIPRLGAAGPGLRLAAVHDGDIVGVARIDATAALGPELLVAVVEPWRRHGIASALGRAIVGRAHATGIERIVLRTGGRRVDLREAGAALGFLVVDLGGGRLDLLRTLTPLPRSA